jgi:hypothetical protein
MSVDAHDSELREILRRIANLKRSAVAVGEGSQMGQELLITAELLRRELDGHRDLTKEKWPGELTRDAMTPQPALTTRLFWTTGTNDSNRVIQSRSHGVN